VSTNAPETNAPVNSQVMLTNTPATNPSAK